MLRNTALATLVALSLAPTGAAQIQCNTADLNMSWQVQGDNLWAQIQLANAPAERPFLLFAGLEPPDPSFFVPCVNPLSLFVVLQGMTDAQGNVAITAPLPGTYDIPDTYLTAVVAPVVAGGPVPATGQVAVAAKKKPLPCDPLAGFSVKKGPPCSVQLAGKFCPGSKITIELTTPPPGGGVTEIFSTNYTSGTYTSPSIPFPCPPVGSKLTVKIDGVTFLWPIRW